MSDQNGPKGTKMDGYLQFVTYLDIHTGSPRTGAIGEKAGQSYYYLETAIPNLLLDMGISYATPKRVEMEFYAVFPPILNN